MRWGNELKGVKRAGEDNEMFKEPKGWGKREGKTREHVMVLFFLYIS